jgi:hypothetical protein
MRSRMVWSPPTRRHWMRLRVVDVERCDVAKCGRGLHVEEARIEAVQLAHG